MCSGRSRYLVACRFGQLAQTWPADRPRSIGRRTRTAARRPRRRHSARPRRAQRPMNALRRRVAHGRRRGSAGSPASGTGCGVVVGHTSQLIVGRRRCLLLDHDQQPARLRPSRLGHGHFFDAPGRRDGQLVLHLHGFDDDQALARGDLVARLHEHRTTRPGIGAVTRCSPAAAGAPAARPRSRRPSTDHRRRSTCGNCSSHSPPAPASRPHRRRAAIVEGSDRPRSVVRAIDERP